MKIFVTRQTPGNALEELKKVHQVEIWPGPGTIPREILLKKVSGAGAIIPMLTEKIDTELFMAAGPDLKIVANYAVGFDNIDLNAARQKNIAVTNTPSRLGDSVAELTITLILALSRRIVAADRWMRQGNYVSWDPSLFLGQDLSRKTLGIVGMGTIGFEVARRADSLLGMKILYTARSQKPDAAAHNYKFISLPELLKTSDVVSLHVPLTPETHHLIDKDQLASMKPTAILINTARGPVVDETALYDALVNKKLWGAAIDVYENETGLTDDPIWWKMTKLSNIIMTPHIGSATEEARAEMTKIAVENVLAVLSGNPPINPIV
ncbi:D-glycerate dehydrogenase [Candidatus Collierbacteria bacterium]|nr:D-glycerate dehydrogenase [Candidatus Collierbacteria bacterium]